MAAIFQIRRGTTNVSLTEGELYLHQGSGSLQFGSGSNNYNVLTLNAPAHGDINLIGNISASGDIRLGGNIYLGDNLANDSVNVNSSFSGSILPSGSNIFDLGSTTLKYRNVYATSISGAIAATNGVISGSSQVVASLPQGLVSGSSQVIGILDSLNSLTGSYATTGSNTFKGNQRITGSLSISNGQFNVITGSGALTSSLTFTHNITAPNDGNAILELRHNNELYNDDIAIKLKADFAGAYLDYEEDTVAYPVLSVQSFANKNLYVHQDTRLLFSSLRIDENLTVTGSIIGLSGFTGSFSGSIPIQDGRLTNLESKSASVDISVAELNSYTSSLKTAITASGANVTINGNLTVKGTTTQIDSTTLNIGDNIIELNYGGSQTLSGIYTKDATGTLSSGSLLWNATTDRWIAGVSGSESTILLAGGDSVFTSSLQLTQINNTTASLNQTTASLNSFSASVTASLESIYQTTASLNLFSASVTASLVSVYQTTASLNTYTQSVNSDLASIHQSSASLNLFSASVTASLSSIYQTTASINLFTASVTSSLESIYQTTASLNSFTGSQLTQNTALATVTGSLIVSASQSYLSASLMTSSVKDHEERIVYLEGIGGISGGNPLTQLNIFSASAKISIENLNAATSSYETKGRSIVSSSAQITAFGFISSSQTINTASLATTGSNSFNGNQQITGSLLVSQNITGSASASFVSLAVNTTTPTQKIHLKGIVGIEAGTTGGNTADQIIFGYNGSGFSQYNHKIQTGHDAQAALNRMDFLLANSSNTWKTPLQLRPDIVYVSGSLIVTGSINGTINATNGVISGSSQILGASGIVSGSSQITYASISSIPSGIVSGAAQIPALLPSGVVSGSSQVTYASISSIPSGIISGSSQLSGTTITNLTITNLTTVNQTASVLFSSGSNKFGDFSDDTHSFTGSVQISGSLTTIGISTATSFNGAINSTNGVVSGSSQILGASGIVSGSSQITYASISSIPSGIVSGAAQIPALLPSGVVSGSSQIITADSVTLGTHTAGNYVAVVSGSVNQITVAGSGLESAVVTLSLPQNIHTSADIQFNSLGIGTAASTVAGEIRATGDITAFYSSDIRLKENIVPIPNALEKVNQISGNTYDWKEGYEEIHSHKGNDVGVIAQEIEQILPQIVTNRDNGFKAVQYEKIVPLLIEAIKELSAKIKVLENK